MRVFLTGATGFIGSRIVPELIAAGHQVLGLTRSDAGAQALADAGAEPYRGTIEDVDGLRLAAAQADAVIHTAFDHDFSNFVANCEKDRRVILGLGAELKGTDKPLIITSGVGMGQTHHGALATEDVFNPNDPNPRVASEIAGNELLAEGVDVRVMRLPQVHDRFRQGLISPYIEIAREKGVAAYIGEGSNRSPAAHVSDVPKLYTLALDRGQAGGRYHAVAEEGVPLREIAEVVAKKFGLSTASLSPEEAAAHFGWFALFASLDMPASSAWTRAQLGWQPTGPGLMTDLENAG